MLKIRSLPREEAAKVDSDLQQTAAENAKLVNFTRNLQLDIATAQSLMGEGLVICHQFVAVVA